MTNLKKEIAENGIHYTLYGDYYFPDLELPVSPRQTIGRYGRMRKAYLEEHRPGLYTRLILYPASCMSIWQKSTLAALTEWIE